MFGALWNDFGLWGIIGSVGAIVLLGAGLMTLGGGNKKDKGE